MRILDQHFDETKKLVINGVYNQLSMQNRLTCILKGGMSHDIYYYIRSFHS